jgi:hypothetical protein
MCVCQVSSLAASSPCTCGAMPICMMCLLFLCQFYPLGNIITLAGFGNLRCVMCVCVCVCVYFVGQVLSSQQHHHSGWLRCDVSGVRVFCVLCLYAPPLGQYMYHHVAGFRPSVPSVTPSRPPSFFPFFLSFLPTLTFPFLFPYSGEIEFWERRKRELISRQQAPDSTVFEWCPDSRHFVTATTFPRLKVDNG